MQESIKNTNKARYDNYENFYSRIKNRVTDMKNKKSVLFYFSIILLNLSIIVVMWGIETYRNGNEPFLNLSNSINWKYLLLICSIFLLVYLLKVFPDYLRLYSKNRQRKFFVLINGNIKNDFYNGVTIYSGGGYPIFAEYLSNKNVENRLAVDVVYGKKFFNKISTIIYSFIVLVLGCCFVFDLSYIWCFLASLIAFSLNCIIVVFVLYFDKCKERYFKLIGSICKFLYKIRIIKDYDKLYTRIVDRLIIYNQSLKANKIVILLQISFGILIKILRHTILFVILVMLNYGSIEAYMTILFGLTIMDLVFEIFPLGHGTGIFELLFLLIFRSVFFRGYVLWAMLFYRFIDYFIYVILFLITKIFDCIKFRDKGLVDTENSNI